MENSAIRFWQWFEAHHSGYLFLSEVKPDVKEKLMDALMTELHRYHPKLYFETGIREEDVPELIITAEGKRDYFEDVEYLVARAPKIANWKFTAFIQPQGVEFTMQWDDVALEPKSIWFLPLTHPENINHTGIRVCLPNYEEVRDKENLLSAVYKMLDTVIGERSFALDIQYVDAAALPEDPESEGLFELWELPQYLAWKKRSLA